MKILHKSITLATFTEIASMAKNRKKGREREYYVGEGTKKCKFEGKNRRLEETVRRKTGRFVLRIYPGETRERNEYTDK